MAKRPASPFRNTFTTAAKGQKEARLLAEKELSERLSSKIILNPDEVYGDYDFHRALMTTLGGKARMITMDDLKQFAYTARVMGKKFVGGITAKQVIDFSLPDRRERARQEIRTALPTTYRGNRVQFQTNSGPNSKVQRHYVTIEFLTFDAAVASPLPASKIVGEVLKGKIKLDCNCEDFRFVFRYIATIGRFSALRNETGFPKIRNPQLHGIACKHCLRVMALITQSPTFKNYAIRMIEVARATLSRQRKVVKVADMEEFAAKLRKESHRQRTIKTTDQKRMERIAASQRRAARAGVDLQKRAADRARAKEVAKAAKSKASALKGLEDNARKLLGLGAINQQQFDQMMAAARASQ